MKKLKSANTGTLAQYAEIHRQRKTYGVSGIAQLRNAYVSARHIAPQVILDFGCGRSTLVDELSAKLDASGYRYDPAIEKYSQLPVESADLVLNTDVLEHLTELDTDLLISDIKRISENAFFNISTREADEILPNRESAHLTVRGASWWEARLSRHFDIVTALHSRTDEATFVTWRVPLVKRLYLRWRMTFANLYRGVVRRSRN